MGSQSLSVRTSAAHQTRAAHMDFSTEFMIGVVVALLGASLQSLGLCLWKLDSTMRADARVIEEETPENKGMLSETTVAAARSRWQQHVHTFSCVWTVGFVMFGVGNLCDFVALGIAPLSTVALLGSWSLVVNPLAAHFVLHEVVTRFDIASIALIVTGIVVMVMGTDHAPNDWTLARLVHQYREPEVVVLLVCLSCFVFASIAIISVDARARAHVCTAPNTKQPGPGKYIRLLYVVVGSAVGNFTALFGKAFSGLLFVSMSSQDQFKDDPFVIVIVVVFAVSLPLQIHLINASLAVNDILFHMPNFYVFWYLGNITTGAVFYGETAHFGRRNWEFFCAGITLLGLGVLGTNIAASYKRVCEDDHRATTVAVSRHYHNIKDTDNNDKHDFVVSDIIVQTPDATQSQHPMPVPHMPHVTDERPDDSTHTLLATHHVEERGS